MTGLTVFVWQKVVHNASTMLQSDMLYLNLTLPAPPTIIEKKDVFFYCGYM